MNGAILLVGDAPYYARFGFTHAPVADLHLPGPVDRARFLGLASLFFVEDDDEAALRKDLQQAHDAGIRACAIVFLHGWHFTAHEAAAARLKAAGRLYACYDTSEELDRRRKVQLSRGLPPIYDRAALKLSVCAGLVLTVSVNSKGGAGA